MGEKQFEQNDVGWKLKHIVYYPIFFPKQISDENILNVKKLSKIYIFGGFDDLGYFDGFGAFVGLIVFGGIDDIDDLERLL